MRKPGKYNEEERQVGQPQADQATSTSCPRPPGTCSTPAACCTAPSNGGKNWSTMTAVGTNAIYGLGFGVRLQGLRGDQASFGDTRAGYLLRTNDSGKTWTPEYVVSEPIDAEGVAAGANSVGLPAGRLVEPALHLDGGPTGRPRRSRSPPRRRSSRRSRRGNTRSPASSAPTQGADRVTVGYLPNAGLDGRPLADGEGRRATAATRRAGGSARARTRSSPSGPATPERRQGAPRRWW